ncbi:MAG: SDR family NAD(P)-dependent oxidoreductase [Promethearchaeota archaeon]
MKFKDKVALVTGGSKGIGRATVLALAKEGANVAINFLSSGEAAGQVKREVEQLGRRAILVQADVSIKSQVDEMVVKTIEEFGKIDILINNAGMSRSMDILELTEEIWDEVVNINMKGTFLVSQVVARRMLESGSGVIINLSSIAGMVGETSTAPAIHYNAAKQGIVAMTRTMANAWAPTIRTNAIAPGVIHTDFHEKSGGSINKMKKRSLDCLLKRPGTPEEIASIAVFLASDDSKYIIGQTIVADGGLGMP